MKRLLVTALLALWASTSVAQSQQYDHLEAIGHNRTLVFMDRNGHCEWGPIKSLTPTAVEINKFQDASVLLQRKDLYMVGESAKSQDLIYSGVSSWSDVIRVTPGHEEKLFVRLKNGKTYKFKPEKVTDTQILFKSNRRTVTLQKNDIQTVDYYR